MRTTGRVLFSPKAMRAIVTPSTLAPKRLATIRYMIRKAVTSAVDDMIFIREKADARTKRHVEQEAERLARAVGTTPGALEAGRDSMSEPSGGACPDQPAAGSRGGQELDATFW